MTIVGAARGDPGLERLLEAAGVTTLPAIYTANWALLGTEGGEPIGFVAGTWPTQEAGWVQHLYVRPERRSFRRAWQLWTAAVGLLASRGAHRFLVRLRAEDDERYQALLRRQHAILAGVDEGGNLWWMVPLGA